MFSGLRRHAIPLLVVVTTAAGLQRSVALLGFDLHHDGLMYDAAFRLFSGEIPYRDFFYQYNLGTVFLHALSLTLFGPVVASLKLVTVIAYAAIAATIYLCAVRVAGISSAFLMALAWSLLSPFHFPELTGYHAWSTVYMTACIMIGVYLLILSFNRYSDMLAGGGGFFIALSFWFKQIAIVHGVGAFVLLFWIAVTTRNRMPGNRERRILSGFLTGVVVCWLPFLFYLGYHDIWLDWWRSAFLFNGAWALGQREATAIGRLPSILFHPNYEFGYVSIIWAVVPAYLAASVILRVLYGKKAGWCSTPRRQESCLLALLGLAGWFMYYPVPHSFHTQMFMAPVFPLIALEASRLATSSRQGFDPGWTRPLRVAMMSLVLALLAYEGARHGEGLYRKLQQPWRLVQSGSIADGLYLQPTEWNSFSEFHRALVRLPHLDREKVPLSADPLRVLFPYVRNESIIYRMGVDWTWLTERVEPGFRDRVRSSLRERKSLVYADGALAIPGYVPRALLVKGERAKFVRMVYSPSLDKAVPAGHNLIAEMLTHDGRCVAIRGEVNSMLIPMVRDSGSPVRLVSQIHALVLRDADVPGRLFPEQHEWMKLLAKDTESSAILGSYEYDFGVYRLNPHLGAEGRFLLGKFFLSHGKLLAAQDSIRFVSTLHDLPSQRPFLLNRTAAAVELAWPSAAGSMGRERGRGQPDAIAVPVPGYAETEPATLYWQIVHVDGTTTYGHARYPGHPVELEQRQ